MQKNTRHLFSKWLMAAILAFSLTQCTPHGPAIVLTFDDKYIDNWHSYMPYFKKNGVKATFYISAYHRFTEDEKAKLLEMQNKYGCEVGHHSKNHPRLYDFLKENSSQDYIDKEILPTLHAMRADGFDVQNFAYPFGEATDKMDTLLWQHFKSVRHLAWTNPERPLIKQGMVFYDFENIKMRNGRLHAAGIDSGYVITTAQIIEAIDSCVENNKNLMLFGHSIGEGGDYSLPEDRLKKLVAYARKRGMRFITVREMLGE